jgi:hypothetical protein
LREGTIVSTTDALITKTEAAVDRVNPSPERVPPSDQTPLAFTDAQLDTIMRHAAPLHPRVRRAFVEAVANALRGKVLGDGSVYLACRQVLRDSTMFDPPELSGRATKWDR